METHNLTFAVPDAVHSDRVEVTVHFDKDQHSAFREYVVWLRGHFEKVGLRLATLVPRAYLVAECEREENGQTLEVKAWGPSFDVPDHTQEQAADALDENAERAEELADAEEESRERELAAREEGVGGQEDPETAHDGTF